MRLGRRRRGGIVGLALAGMMLAAAPIDAAPPATVERPASEAAGHRIALTLPDREPVSLYYEEHGSGPPLLLLHGLGESLFTWHEILPALAARHHVIALDLKGFGRSDKPDDGAYTADDQAALVARFIAERGLDGLTVIGHSFGGTVALRTALADGIAGTTRIRRIAVIGAPALPRATARYLDLVMTPLIPDTFAAVLPPDAMARLLLKEAMGGRTPSEKNVEGYAAPYREHAAMRAFFATARSIIAEHDAKAIAARYRAVKQPVLVVWCRKDPIVSLRSGRQLAAALPRGRLVVLEGCHHLPQHERPQTLLRTLRPFLAR